MRFFLLLLFGATFAFAGETRDFSLPRGDAVETLKLFAIQANKEILYSSKHVAGVTTNPVSGKYFPRASLDLMLAGTGLVVIEDRATGALMVNRPTSGGQTPPSAAVAPADPPAQKTKDEPVKLEDLVVTGVFSPTAANKATTAITSLNQDLLSTQVPISAADMLLNVSGVYVNSSLGEIRNIVYSRGVSANSSDGSNGYYYVSMQEDGLPITYVNFNNYGPDYFLRPDATLLRIEAVRGGSAAITAGNAPGGVFNYISKTGGSTFGGEVSTRIGLEGRNSPYYRGDFDVGGPIGQSAWRYNLGGFYRESNGYRPTVGYPMNNGGAIRGNLLKDYGRGSVKIYAKYHNDHNHWYEYLLARNPQDPVQAPGLSRYSTNLFPEASFDFPRGSETNVDHWDTREKVHSTQRLVGVDWDHDFGNGWSINNNVKATLNHLDWNASAGVSPRSLAWPNFFSAMGFQFSAGPLNGQVPAGTYQFRDLKTKALIAEVTSNGSYSVNGSAPSDPGQVVTFSKLPNRNLEIAENSFDGVWTNTARVNNEHMAELMDKLTITKKLGAMTFTVGMFYSYADISSKAGSGGRTASPLSEQPIPLDITWIAATAAHAPAGTPADALAAVAGWNGQTVQLTNPAGYAMLGAGYGRNEALAKDVAVFFAHNWSITKKWGMDWGVRASNYVIGGVNAAAMNNPRANMDPTYGGPDGNPLTLFDARWQMEDPTQVWRYNKNVSSLSWSVGTSYVFNDSNSVYLRYASGEKTPEFVFFRNYTSQFRIDNLVGRPQTTKQWELGYRYNHGPYKLTITPFYSRLGNIFGNLQATEADGVTPYYPDPLYNVVTTYGVELEGEFALTKNFSIRSVFTWQHSVGTVWKEFFANGNGRADDEYRDFSGKPSDNNPDFILNTTANYRYKRLFASLAWKHMGARAGNIANVIILPSFDQFDLNLRYDVTDHLTVGFTVNNLTDSQGVMTWRGWGVNPADRQSFYTLPSTGADTTLQYVPIQPRAYFGSVTYKF